MEYLSINGRDEVSESVITKEMKDAIGVESDPVVYQIEEGAILRFAEAIGDTNPIFNDKNEASKTKYGGIVAPPTFLRSIAHVKAPEPKVQVKSPYPANVDGGSEWEYFEPIKVGDTITATSYLADINERKGGKFGSMLIMVRETKYINQHGTVAALQRTTGISYQPPE
ncbi:MAG TPA: MaoC family dehydratase [Dehalococcoidia bacterium]|nr:dehydratase [Chloroflexota bacterium]HCE75008.1 MaoC family dehydratase [Dehalococcoidia bacterium]|tara:strand:+ start:1099 stop:1605 length:507 start_codon:yes stop_codon:yes gene_type:complete